MAQQPTTPSGFVDLNMPVDLNMVDADAARVGQQDQSANVNSANPQFDFSIWPQPTPPNSGYPQLGGIRQSLETEYGYHPSFGHYSFTQERRADEQIPNQQHTPPNASSFTPVPPVFSASQANSFPTPSRVPSPTPSSPVEWSPSLPPPERPRQLFIPNPAPPITPALLTNPAPSANHRGRTNNHSGRGNRGRGTGRGGINRGRGRAGARNVEGVPPEATPPDGNGSENEDNRPRKKGRGRAMNAQEKLVLICECCAHAYDYKPRNKLAFWKMIRKILKDQTGYDLKEPRNTVLRWVSDRGEELVSKEMGFGTQVDQDDFKAAVEQFAGRIKEVDEELESQVKSTQAKAAELYESAHLQSAMVFGLDDEPIAGVDAPSNTPSVTATRASSTSIALNPLARSTSNKRKQEQSSINAGNQAFNETSILLANSFKESTTLLAQALATSSQAEAMPSTRTSEPSILSLDERISRMESCLTDVQSGLEARLGDVTGLLGRILAAVGTGTRENREETQAGENN